MVCIQSELKVQLLSQSDVILCKWCSVLISTSPGSYGAAATCYQWERTNISQVQIISSDLWSMYFQLKWHHINLISIDATCNLIFQCMVFSSNWLHRLCKEAYCTDTYKSGARAAVDGCEKTHLWGSHKCGCSSVQKSNSQVLNSATQILFQNHKMFTREVMTFQNALLPVNLFRKTHLFCAK